MSGSEQRMRARQLAAGAGATERKGAPDGNSAEFAGPDPVPACLASALLLLWMTVLRVSGLQRSQRLGSSVGDNRRRGWRSKTVCQSNCCHDKGHRTTYWHVSIRGLQSGAVQLGFSPSRTYDVVHIQGSSSSATRARHCSFFRGSFHAVCLQSAVVFVYTDRTPVEFRRAAPNLFRVSPTGNFSP